MGWHPASRRRFRDAHDSSGRPRSSTRAAQAASLPVHRLTDARARHWRSHGDLQRRQRRAAQAAALPARGAARDHFEHRSRAWLRSLSGLSGPVHVLPAPQHCVRRHGALPVPARQPHADWIARGRRRGSDDALVLRDHWRRFLTRALVCGERGSARRGARGSREPSALDAEIRSGRDARWTDRVNRRRDDGGHRHCAPVGRSRRHSRSLAAGSLQSHESAHGEFRLERRRPIEGRRAHRSGPDEPRVTRHASDGRVHHERYLPRVPQGRRLSSGRPIDEGRHRRHRPRAALDPAGDGRAWFCSWPAGTWRTSV